MDAQSPPTKPSHGIFRGSLKPLAPTHDHQLWNAATPNVQKGQLSVPTSELMCLFHVDAENQAAVLVRPRAVRIPGNTLPVPKSCSRDIVLEARLPHGVARRVGRSARRIVGGDIS